MGPDHMHKYKILKMAKNSYGLKRARPYLPKCHSESRGHFSVTPVTIINQIKHLNRCCNVVPDLQYYGNTLQDYFSCEHCLC